MIIMNIIIIISLAELERVVDVLQEGDDDLVVYVMRVYIIFIT